MPLTNRWNQFIYRLWAPVYDRAFTRLFAAGRRQAIGALAAQPGDRLLLSGIGTGADLPLLPAGLQVVGLDLSPAMLARARARRDRVNGDVLLIQGDAQALPLRGGVCDVEAACFGICSRSPSIWQSRTAMKIGGLESHETDLPPIPN